LRLYFEVQKPQPDMQKIARWMRTYLRVAAVQGTMQVAIILVMARFATLASSSFFTDGDLELCQRPCRPVVWEGYVRPRHRHSRTIQPTTLSPLKTAWRSNCCHIPEMVIQLNY